MRHFSRVLIFATVGLSIGFVLAVPAFAQFGAGIQGTITDKTGAVVTGADVTVTNQATSVSHTAKTNDSGFYRISALEPGTYTVDVEAGSFKKSTTRDVAVGAELVRGLDVTVETGEAKETVIVTEQAAALETEDATVSGTLGARQVESLPAIDRDPYELLRLAPGILGDGARLGNGRSAGCCAGSDHLGDTSCRVRRPASALAEYRL